MFDEFLVQLLPPILFRACKGIERSEKNFVRWSLLVNNMLETVIKWFYNWKKEGGFYMLFHYDKINRVNRRIDRVNGRWKTVGMVRINIDISTFGRGRMGYWCPTRSSKPIENYVFRYGEFDFHVFPPTLI